MTTEETHQHSPPVQEQDEPPALAFSADVFISSSFDVGQFIVQCRKTLPLDAILRDLERYRRTLKAEMMDMINKDYGDFVHLSSQLAGVDEATTKLRDMLIEVHGEISAVETSVSDAMNATESKLEQRKKIATEQENLQLALLIIDSLERLERVLHDPNPTNDATNADTDENGPVSFLTTPHAQTSSFEVAVVDKDAELGRFLEHISAEFQQLHLHVIRAAEMRPIQSLKPRIEDLERMVMEHLEKAFLDVVQRLVSGDQSASGLLARVLRAYGAIDKVAIAESLFQKEIIKPVLNTAVTSVKLQGNGAKGSTDGLNDIYSDIIDTLKRVLMPIIVISEQIEVQFDFAPAAFGAVCDVLINNAAPIFVPGIPSVFRHNHAISMTFLQNFENMLTGHSNITKSSLYADFIKRWNRNLAVYYQLRFQACAREVEDALVNGTDSVDDDRIFVMRATNTIWGLLIQCWRKDGDAMYISDIGHKFVKLTLQLISRYQTWISGLIDDADMELLSKIAVDVTSFGAKLPEFVKGSIMTCLPHDSVEKCVAISVTNLSEVESKIETRLCSNLVERCSAILEPVRRVTGLYRHTNKPMPTSCSSYVSDCMSPVKSFVNSRYGTMMLKPVLIRCLYSIAVDVTRRYHNNVTDVVDALKATEKSIKRLGLGEKSDGGDSAKIKQQLILDIGVFGDLLTAECGVDIGSLDEYQHLVNVCKAI